MLVLRAVRVSDFTRFPTLDTRFCVARDGFRVLLSRPGLAVQDMSVFFLVFTVSCSSGSSPIVRAEAFVSACADWLIRTPRRSAATTTDSW